MPGALPSSAFPIHSVESPRIPGQIVREKPYFLVIREDRAPVTLAKTLRIESTASPRRAKISLFQRDLPHASKDDTALISRCLSGRIEHWQPKPRAFHGKNPRWHAKIRHSPTTIGTSSATLCVWPATLSSSLGTVRSWWARVRASLTTQPLSPATKKEWRAIAGWWLDIPGLTSGTHRLSRI